MTIWRLENIGPNFFKFLSTLSLVNKVTFLYFFVIILITFSKDYGMYLRNVLLVTVDESHFGDQLKSQRTELCKLILYST